MEVIIVGDELHCGVPDVLGGELPSTLNERDHDICVPLQVWEKPVKQKMPGFSYECTYKAGAICATATTVPHDRGTE